MSRQGLLEGRGGGGLLPASRQPLQDVQEVGAGRAGLLQRGTAASEGRRETRRRHKLCGRLQLLQKVRC